MLSPCSVQTHKRLQNLGRPVPKKDADSASVQSSDCSICLGAIAVSLGCFYVQRLKHADSMIAVSISIRRSLFTCLALQVRAAAAQ